MRTLTYYVATSVDGYIASPDHEIDGFDASPELIDHIVAHVPETLPGPARAALGVDGSPNRRFDSVIMGRHTYDLGLREGLTSPYGHLDQIVVSTQLDPDIDPAVEVTAADPIAVVQKLKAGDGRGVWLCGGGTLAGSVIDEIDELILKRNPAVFGSGRPLFDGPYRPRRFDLVDRQPVGDVWLETYRPG